MLQISVIVIVTLLLLVLLPNDHINYFTLAEHFEINYCQRHFQT